MCVWGGKGARVASGRYEEGGGPGGRENSKI